MRRTMGLTRVRRVLLAGRARAVFGVCLAVAVALVAPAAAAAAPPATLSGEEFLVSGSGDRVASRGGRCRTRLRDRPLGLIRARSPRRARRRASTALSTSSRPCPPRSRSALRAWRRRAGEGHDHSQFWLLVPQLVGSPHVPGRHSGVSGHDLHRERQLQRPRFLYLGCVYRFSGNPYRRGFHVVVDAAGADLADQQGSVHERRLEVVRNLVQEPGRLRELRRHRRQALATGSPPTESTSNREAPPRAGPLYSCPPECPSDRQAAVSTPLLLVERTGRAGGEGSR